MALRRKVRDALGLQTRLTEADFAGKILHPNIREVKGFTGRDEMLDDIGACPLYASGAPRRVSLTARVARVVSGNRRPCLEGHGRQRGQSPPLSQLQQIMGGADNAPFALHIFEAP